MVLNQLVHFNTDNVSDLFSITFHQNQILNFIVKDGDNLSKTLANISISDLNTNYFFNDYLVGFFNPSITTNNISLQQILFVYKNNYFKINNDGQFSNPLLNVNSESGLDIKYCSSILYNLSWFLIPNKNIISYVYTQDLIYFTNKVQNISLIMYNYDNLNKPFKQYYTVESITEGGEHVFDSISILFIPNSCNTLPFKTMTTNIVEGSFTGIKIPELNAIISILFVITVISVIIIYRKDHKKL